MILHPYNFTETGIEEQIKVIKGKLLKHFTCNNGNIYEYL